jgi:hypothetical protein
MSPMLARPLAATAATARLPEPSAALNKVRRLAVTCRATRRIDLFHACRMLSDDGAEAGAAFADALIRTLAQGLGRAPVFYRPDAREVSFDERWLMSLMGAVQADDLPSFEFLIRSRLARRTHRHTAFLVRNLALRLDTL